ncbi:protein FAM83H [Amia ocellicauda]|uniref:protein FAM83H n=1 Tax=Amia ocellicauda TaxID=2972642 RepID=UPI003463B1D5
MARRSQSSSVGDNPLDPNYLPPHYREEYRLAIDVLVEDDLEGYYDFLQSQDVVGFLAQPEIDHIKHNVQAPRMIAQPEYPYLESGLPDPEGSSDTYWPLHSDLDAPGLDLGWPHLQHSFIGPTEVTTLVNPSDPNMPSIKEQARRLIKNAMQVIAVVMDMFTDVDIFADLLDAAMRRVPVYVLLDELNAHHFIAMVANCKVNLDLIHFMRVRTVAGTTYFCRTGKSFKGQVMDRFLLSDCKAVLSGNYSFMWSFEKIHRCIAHLFLGELVTTFDEEFRILYAQSQPLVLEKALVPIPGDSGYSTAQYRNTRVPSFRKPKGYLHVESSRHSERSGYSDRMDLERDMMPFRREEPYRLPLDLPPMQMYSQRYGQQFEMERSYMDHGRTVTASNKMEMNAYKRHSYAEGTHESYSSSRQFMKHRVMNNLEETETQSSQYQREHMYRQGEGMGSGKGIYEKIRGYHQVEEYPDDHQYPHDMLEPPGTGNYMLDYMSSTSSKDIKQDSMNVMAPGEGRYGQAPQRRHNSGQPVVCLSSPSQMAPSDQKHLFHESSLERQPEDLGDKQGLRKWRISSFLSNFEDTGEEGLQQPLGSDAFEEPSHPSEGQLHGPEASVPRYATREPPKMPVFKTSDLPRYGRPLLPETSSNVPPGESLLAISKTAVEGAEDTAPKEGRETSITKHESFRTRMNPLLQRSSRLRSSLIFSSSKLEQHSTTQLKTTEMTEEDENDPLRTSSIVAQILEKRRSIVREPFEFNLSSQNKTTTKDSSVADAHITDEKPKVAASEETPNKPAPVEPAKVTPPVKPFLSTMPQVDMNNPEARLSYFKELAAKRKATKMAADAASNSPEPAFKKPDILVTPPAQVSVKPSEPKDKVQEPQAPVQQEVKPAAEVPPKEPAPKSSKPFASPKIFKRDPPTKTPVSRNASCSDDILKDATDSQKSEMKKSRSMSISALASSDNSEKLHKTFGSNSSLNLLDGGEGKQESKAKDFIKKQTQKLKGLLGTKSDKKGTAAATTEEKLAAQTMSTVQEVTEELPSKSPTLSQSSTKSDQVETVKTTETKEEKVVQKPATTKPSQSRFQTSTANVLYSSNLRDDTKVILEQISANSQKNRMEKQSAGSMDSPKEGDNADTTVDSSRNASSYQSRSRFQQTQTNPEDRDNLLKKMESMRKEKKVYSRFEVFYKNKEDGNKNMDSEEEGSVGKTKPKLGLFKSKK